MNVGVTNLLQEDRIVFIFLNETCRAMHGIHPCELWVPEVIKNIGYSHFRHLSTVITW